VTAQRLEKRLEAAEDRAPEDAPLDLDPTDPGSAFHLTRGRPTDEPHLDFLHDQLFGHRL